MKNKKIIIPAVLLALTAASISPFISAQAATNDNNATGTNLTQRMKNFAGYGKHNKNTNKTPKTAAEIAALKTARDTKTAAVTAALESGNYDAWLAAVTALEANPNANANVNATDNHKAKVEAITSKITRDNFPKLVEAYNLEKQLNTKLTELGLDKGNGKGMGLGMGMGMGMGQWK